MPLSIEKCAILHCGNRQLHYPFTIGKQILPIVNKLSDFGVMRNDNINLGSTLPVNSN